jgi:hypothetical protein
MMVEEQGRACFPTDVSDLSAEHSISRKRGILKPNQCARGRASSDCLPENALDFFGDHRWGVCLIRKVVAGWFVNELRGYFEWSKLGVFAIPSTAQERDPLE